MADFLSLVSCSASLSQAMLFDFTFLLGMLLTPPAVGYALLILLWLLLAMLFFRS